MKNLPASVRQRLLNRSKETGEPFDLVLARYALERVLYRLSISSHADRFVLKGALLFSVWGYSDFRPTRDADLLGSGPSDPAHLATVFREVCATAFEDGIGYDPLSVEAVTIAEDKVYSGVRVTLQAGLAGARIPVQLDIGFGDAVTPLPERIEYPVLLEFPPPVLNAYPVYTVIAEKFHAILEGFLGSRRWIAAQMGRIGGKASTKAKSTAARRNGKLGGRPRKIREPA